jgi:hypothetical protein
MTSHLQGKARIVGAAAAGGSYEGSAQPPRVSRRIRRRGSRSQLGVVSHRRGSGERCGRLVARRRWTRRAGLRRLARYLHREVALGSHHALQSHARELPVGVLVGRLRKGRLGLARGTGRGLRRQRSRRRTRLLSARLSKGCLLFELDDLATAASLPARARRSARQRQVEAHLLGRRAREDRRRHLDGGGRARTERWSGRRDRTSIKGRARPASFVFSAA